MTLDPQANDALFRRHLLLTLLGGALALAALALVVVAVRVGLDPVPYDPAPSGAARVRAVRPGAPMVVAAAWLGVGLVTAVLVLLVGHAARVAAFTFRREVS